MSPLTEQPNALWPLVVYLGAVISLILAMLALGHIVGERHRGRAMNEPFESGVRPVGDARMRFSAKFYLVAIFFVIFDLEVVFIFAWGVAALELGWHGYAGAMVFLGVLTAALIYEWRIGALEWAPHVPRRRVPSEHTEPN